MPRRSVRITPTGGGRIPPLFSPAMDNSAVANPGRRARSPLSRKSSPSGKSSRRRLDLSPSGSPNQSNDGSAVRPSTFGGRGRGRGKNNRRGAQRGAARGSNQLRHLQPNRPSAPPSATPAPQQQQQQQQQRQQQQPAGGQAASSATPGRQQSTPPAKGRGRGRGKGQ